MSSRNANRNAFYVAHVRVISLALLLAFFVAPAFSQAGDVHELYYNNSTWTDMDLSTEPGWPTPRYGALAVDYNANSFMSVEFPYWVDANSGDLVSIIYYSRHGGFYDAVPADLTAMAGGPTPSPYGLSAYHARHTTGTLRSTIVYVGTDNHVHSIYSIADSDLTEPLYVQPDQDLTMQSGGPLAYAGDILAMVTEPNDLAHIFYQEMTTFDLHQLFFNGTSWSDEDLTSELGGTYCPPGWIAGFARGNEQHVFCAGYAQNSSSLDMLHFHYNNSNWVLEDVTVAAGGAQTPMQYGSGVSAFSVKGINQMEVYGVTTDAHVHRYYRIGGVKGVGGKTGQPAQWFDQDLSALGAPNDYQIGGMVAFPTTPNNQFHVYYAPDNNVYQLFNPGTGWQVENLTGVGQADNVGGMAGFAVGNEQHVYYISTGN